VQAALCDVKLLLVLTGTVDNIMSWATVDFSSTPAWEGNKSSTDEMSQKQSVQHRIAQQTMPAADGLLTARRNKRTNGVKLPISGDAESSTNGVVFVSV
jgi:hypothetical protein